MAKLEKEIAKLTADKDRLENVMAAPDFYSRADAARNTQKEYNDLIETLAAKEAEWLAAAG